MDELNIVYADNVAMLGDSKKEICNNTKNT